MSPDAPCFAFSAPYARTTMMECGTVTQYCMHTRGLKCQSGPRSRCLGGCGMHCAVVLCVRAAYRRACTAAPSIALQSVLAAVTHRKECAQGVH
jgi:hypothetical protein